MRGESEHPPYPVGLRLAGRAVVVVGGGQVAGRRIPALLASGADVTVVSPSVRPALEGMADAGELRWIPRKYEDGDLSDAWYAIAAASDPTVNSAVVAEADRRRIFCVRADDARQASAWTPASGRHDNVTIAVLSNRDPRRSARLRDAIVERLRDGDLADRPFRDHSPGVVLVGGGPGDPELITLAGRRALAEADLVIADHLAPRELLSELPSHVEVVDASKLPRGRAAAQAEINRLCIEGFRAGQRVVRLKGGDPFVFGRGHEEVQACADAGVPCTVLPGLTSAIAVPALAGIPVTHRGVAHGFTVVSGHLAPDDPGSLVDWSALGRLGGTLVLLMAVANLRPIADRLLREGRAADTPAAVVVEGSMPGERRVVTRLGQLADEAETAGVRAPAIIVIGEVVTLADDARESPPMPSTNLEGFG
ncbi:MAG TPA: uroporphyrinogen-III C-methyltransferase [Nocardioidaceae bacterium]|nr:uroporphyrinogen-III C-methyltransferase [Nocardioidaceae bacterium]